MKKLIISEQERNYIRNLYDLPLLNEQETEDDKPTEGKKSDLKIEQKIEFPSGFYNSSYLASLSLNLDKIKNFLITNSGNSYVVDVTIQASESRIPNTDNESSERSPLAQFELSNKRKDTIVKYLNEYWNNSGLSNIDVINTPVDTLLGDTKWVGQDFCPANSLKPDDKEGRDCLRGDFQTKNGKPNWVKGKKTIYKDIWSAYTQEQYVYVTITVNKKETKEPDELSCLNNMKIMINYIAPGPHTCNSAIYEIYINNVLLKRDGDGRPYASLNNGTSKGTFKSHIEKGGKITAKDIVYYDNDITGPDSEPKQGGSRYNYFTINSELAKSLLGTSKTFQIQAKCINPTNQAAHGGGCHKDVSKIQIVNGAGKTQSYEVKTPSKRDELKTIVTIDACGNRIS